MAGTTYDKPNAFEYIGNQSPTSTSIQTLTGLPSMNPAPLVFPPGLGGTPLANGSLNSEKTIPFTLFLPYKRANGAYALRSTMTGNELFTKMPQPEFAIALPTPTSALKTQYGVEYSPFEVGGMVGGAITTTAGLRDTIGGLVSGGWEKAQEKGVGGIIEELTPKALEAGKNLMTGAGINLAQKLSEVLTSQETVPALFGIQENPYTEFIFKNVTRLKTRTPIADATPRPLMPQTDKAGDVSVSKGIPAGLQALAAGEVDVNKPYKVNELKKIIMQELAKVLQEKTFAGKKELDNDGDGVPKWADKDDNDPKVGSKSSKKKDGEVPPQLQKFVKSKKTGREELDEMSSMSAGAVEGYAGGKQEVEEEGGVIFEYLSESEVKKKNPPLGKVTRNPAGSNKKFHVYVK